MGRRPTGITTVKQAQRLEITPFLRSLGEAAQKGATGILTLPNGSEMAFKAIYTEGRGWVELSYRIQYQDGPQDYLYRVEIESVPSNLGRGAVPDFICPWSRIRCKALYMAYGSPVLKARAAYANRIYYPAQLSSRLSRFNDRYWALEDELVRLCGERRSYSYLGKPTRKYKRIERLADLRDYYERARWSPLAIPKSLLPILYGDELGGITGAQE